MLKKLAPLFLLAATLITSAPVRAADTALKVTRVAVSTENQTLQVFLSSPVGKGACDNDYKVAARLDSPAAEALMQLAIAAQLSGKPVEITTKAGKAADCVAESPQLVYLKMLD